jgi:uncharacterized protein (TIGR00369 family)
MQQFNDDNYCFACGVQNPVGLKLAFHYHEETGEMISQAVFPRHFQGWQGVLHGGLISTALDEVMVKAAAQKGLKCVTAELNVRFKNPAFLTKDFTIKGKITGIRKRVILGEGCVTDSDNTLIATANGKFITIDQEEKCP